MTYFGTTLRMPAGLASHTLLEGRVWLVKSMRRGHVFCQTECRGLDEAESAAERSAEALCCSTQGM